MFRRQFLGSISAAAALIPSLSLASESRSLIQSITPETLRRNRDGQSETWFHPRACMVPRGDGSSFALMTMQWIRGSDYFGPVHWTRSDDQGTTWSDPEPIDALGRVPVPEHDGLMAGVCDVVPEYHAMSNTVLAMGHVVFYRGERFSSREQLSRYPVYTVRRSNGTWSERKILHWDDPRGSFIYTNNCGQRTVNADGDIIMSLTFGATSKNRSVAGVRCTFDGEQLNIVDVGPALTLNAGRGLLEPSVTRWNDRYYITLRAEDGHGYVASSRDGLNYGEKRAWCWDDNTPIAMSTTQQHWVNHPQGLFLVYTREDKTNKNVMRWRAPLWIAQVDPERLCLLRDTERIVLPMVGDGVDHPDEVALMGNFHVTDASPQETWVTVGEWIPKRSARGDLKMARIKWAEGKKVRSEE
ncbi:sialidase family protein [Novipirellula maiorica]|nr:sialidase family protein [Rhodopirellula maiorica]